MGTRVWGTDGPLGVYRGQSSGGFLNPRNQMYKHTLQLTSAF